MDNNNSFWNKISGQWKQFIGEAKIRWGKLNDDELTRLEGNRDKLVGLVQERYGIAMEEAQRQVDEWGEQVLERLERTHS